MRARSVLSWGLIGLLAASASASALACSAPSEPSDGDPATGGNGTSTGGGLPGDGGSSSGGKGTGTGGNGTSSGGGLGLGGLPGLGGGSGVPDEGDVPEPEAPVSAFIVVDQFGYLEDSEKVAVLRDPEVGYDAGESYAFGSQYQVINAVDGSVALEVSPEPWNNGQVDESSGDKAARLDFSAVTSPGVYYVLDVAGGVRSDLFRIASDVYRKAYFHAFRTFFYQRAGFDKKAEFAGEAWADGPSHVKPGQDTEARLVTAQDDGGTARDLSGGWYDAGDYNRYTPWEADYVTTLLRIHTERPEIGWDSFNIPESGNGVSDVLDEARFGLEHLVKMQSESGGCLSVLGTNPQYVSASPPSSLGADVKGVYGSESTNATIRAGMAFAWAAEAFKATDPAFADDMLARAEKAWEWAEANPAVEFSNTANALAAGEQQSSAADVARYKLGFAVALYRATGDAAYKSFFEDGYQAASLSFLNGYNAGWELQFTEFFLDYARLADADAGIQSEILDAFSSTLDSNTGLAQKDPYFAYVDAYTWGSNAHKARTGCLYHDTITFDVDPAKAAEARISAERYLHYLHGVNPLGIVYLTNMNSEGTHRSATTIYHSWFADGSPLWDEVGVSTYGPVPGFVPGGPNPSYAAAGGPTPPIGQPAQKSYGDFNDSYPVNSWEVTENSNGYQTYYIRLVSKFVN